MAIDITLLSNNWLLDAHIEPRHVLFLQSTNSLLIDMPWNQVVECLPPADPTKPCSVSMYSYCRGEHGSRGVPDHQVAPRNPVRCSPLAPTGNPVRRRCNRFFLLPRCVALAESTTRLQQVVPCQPPPLRPGDVGFVGWFPHDGWFRVLGED